MGFSWSDMYREVPPWDIGRPQPEFVRFQASGRLRSRGALLDVGCGTGENALFFASKGYPVLGIDLVPRAVEFATQKARERKLRAEFRVSNALELPSIGKTFDVVIDSGLFHTFSDEDRLTYLNSVSRVLRPGGAFAMLCFSEKEPADWGGPRRVRRDEIETSFDPYLEIEEIREARFATRLHNGDGGFAWFTLAWKPRSRGSGPSRPRGASR